MERSHFDRVMDTESRKFAAYDKKTGEILYTYSVDTQSQSDPSQIVEFIPNDEVTNKERQHIDRKDIEFTFFDLPENSNIMEDAFVVKTDTKKIQKKEK